MKRIFLYIILFITLAKLSFGNSTKIDSLRIVFQNETNDSMRMEISKKLGIQWENISFDSALFYYNYGIKIAVDNGYFSRAGVFEVNKAFASKFNNREKESIKALETSLKYYRQVKDSAGILLATYNLGTFSLENEDFSSAILYYKKAIDLAETLNDDNYLIWSLNNINTAFQYIGDYESSITYLLKGLKIREEKYPDQVGYSYNNLGLLYNEQGDYFKSISYYK